LSGPDLNPRKKSKDFGLSGRSLNQRKKNEGFQLAATETLLKLAVRKWINPFRRPTATIGIVLSASKSRKKEIWLGNPVQQSKSLAKLKDYQV
jgi:hypothetical protein